MFVGPVGAAVTATVALEAAVAGPSEFEAVTRTLSREPTSPVAAMYAVVVAPPITAQSDPSSAPPEAGQRTHWYVYEVGVLLHVPCVPVSVCPTEPGSR